MERGAGAHKLQRRKVLESVLTISHLGSRELRGRACQPRSHFKRTARYLPLDGYHPRPRHRSGVQASSPQPDASVQSTTCTVVRRGAAGGVWSQTRTGKQLATLGEPQCSLCGFKISPLNAHRPTLVPGMVCPLWNLPLPSDSVSPSSHLLPPLPFLEGLAASWMEVGRDSDSFYIQQASS